jgi:hypothetical protein
MRHIARNVNASSLDHSTPESADNDQQPIFMDFCAGILFECEREFW